MHADIEDRIGGEPPKNNPFKWIIFLTIGAGLCFGSLWAFDRFIGVDHLTIKAPDDAIIYHKYTKEVKSINNEDEPIVITGNIRPNQIELSKGQLNSEGKQIVYNSNNYTPKGATNSMQPPSKRHFTNNNTSTNTQNHIASYSARWEWKNFRETVYGEFNYTVINDSIDTASVCNNYKYGSLIYRDCRKAAKRYFNQHCNNNVFCTARNMIP